jgi:large subunit ribosomal protein L4
MKLDVLNSQGSVVSSVELNDSIFGLNVRKDILARVVTWQLAKRQAGTHKTKQRSEVSGSTRKIIRQKGSGGARHGSKRAPIFRGGGIAFGPVVRSHAFDLPKKVRALGLKMALSAKANAGELILLENFAVDAKTKSAITMLQQFAPKNALLIDGAVANENMKRAVSNLNTYDILPTMGANVYDIIRKEKLILSVDAVKALEERLK